MDHYDVLIVGGATAGSYFARRMAERGHKVIVVEKDSPDKVGDKYDIFHIGKPDFARFHLPMPEKDQDMAFDFTGGRAFSAFGHYPKKSNDTTVGMHMHLYTLRLNQWAIDAGAEFHYGALFLNFVYENGKIVGARIAENGEEKEIRASLVADCSGIPSVARTKLPDNYGVENFVIGPKDMFYVILRYVKYLDEKDYLKSSRGWTYYKTWEAPQPDPHGAILGIGANFGFDYAEKIYSEFEKAVPLPRQELQYKEHGMTPYRRPPYSFVADGFVAMGDTACLTKPHAGEGVTSSMVQADIAIEVIDGLLKAGQSLTRENMWAINKRYYAGQGKVFAGMLATLVGAVATNTRENEFFFKHDIIFSAKSFANMGDGKPLSYSSKEMTVMALKMFWGIITFRLRISTIRTLLNAMKNGNIITELYAEYPDKEADFPAWVQKAATTWEATPKMGDVAH